MIPLLHWGAFFLHNDSGGSSTLIASKCSYSLLVFKKLLPSTTIGSVESDVRCTNEEVMSAEHHTRKTRSMSFHVPSSHIMGGLAGQRGD